MLQFLLSRRLLCFVWMLYWANSTLVPGALFPFPSCYTLLQGTESSYKEGPDRMHTALGRQSARTPAPQDTLVTYAGRPLNPMCVGVARPRSSTHRARDARPPGNTDKALGIKVGGRADKDSSLVGE